MLGGKFRSQKGTLRMDGHWYGHSRTFRCRSWPELCYPLVWLSPLLILLGFQVIFEEHHIFKYVKVGDWRPVVIPALAGLICGVFWEMWNYYSLAQWKYVIPYLHGSKYSRCHYWGFQDTCPLELPAPHLSNISLAGNPRH